MQALGAVTVAQLLSSVQQMKYKLEVYNGSSWLDLCSLGGNNYLKSVSISLGGAGVSPEPIAGTWSAELDNYNAIFHPQNTASSYDDLLRVGRQVRISVGGVYGGSAVYWQRIIGYMDTPRFNHASRTVHISGTDYMQDLLDTELRSPDNYWGASTTISTTATTVTLGAEIYDEADCLEIGAGEADNVTNWTPAAPVDFTSEAEVGGGSTYAAKLLRAETGAGATVTNTNVGAVTEGTVYQCTFKYRRIATAGALACRIYETGTSNLMGSVTGLVSDAWATTSFQFTATASVNMQMTFQITPTVPVNGYFWIDEMSIKPVSDSGFNVSYALPEASNGPYYATLNTGGGAEPIYMGDPAESFGWVYSEDVGAFGFVNGAVIATGTNNLVVYYYTTQTVENVVADILVTAGLYASQAAALAAMTYTATGVTVERVWFDAGTTCLAAIAKLCERVNYRFWFDYAGAPHFSPAPTEGAPDFTFTAVQHIAEEEMYQDLNEVKNTIVIEGIEQAMYGSTEKTQTSRLVCEATSDATSVAAYREKVLSMTNHLFQDQAAIDDMADTLLAAYKDPKWYSNVTVKHNPAPIELGDTIRYTIQLEAAYGWPLYGNVVYGTASYASNGTTATVDGLVRDIKITNGQTVYVCEATAA